MEVTNYIVGIGNRNFIIISARKINKIAIFSCSKRMSIHIKGKGLMVLTTRTNNRPTVAIIVVMDFHITCSPDYFFSLIHRNPIAPRRKGIFTRYLLSPRPKGGTGIGTGHGHGQQHGQNTSA
ncbi:hypothetical protein [uncultured Megasphaera sp.]|uniref:hypothetical protein n=1 Tax=Megasphaera massiliensis TaxID=1232428 RepID=UPI00258F702A|nr:hypothetical protein [uncultured Megasphaera sp.]